MFPHAPAHAAGVPLVVDQSWGPHFGFHREPAAKRAARQGADAMLTSVHKIAGSLTQSALLHVSGLGAHRPRRRGARAAAGALDLAVVAADAVAGRRTPPAGAARRGALSGTIAASRRTRRAIDQIPGCRVVGDEEIGRPGVAAPRPAADRDRRPRDGRDRLRDGGRAALELRHAGRARHAGDDRARARHRRAAARARALPPRPRTSIAAKMERPGETEEVTLASGTFENEVVVAPREAFLGASDVVAVDDSVGD